MKRTILAAILLGGAVLTSPANADIIATGTFTSDHCDGGCGPQTGGFGSITATDHENGTIDISILLFNQNTFVNGGQDVTFGFNLLPTVGGPTITYSNLDTTSPDPVWAVAGVPVGTLT